MKDAIIKFLASVAIGAMVSASFLYIAFDQALRGVETAIVTTNERITDTNASSRDIGQALAVQGDKLDAILMRIDKGFAGLESSIKSSNQTIKSTQFSFVQKLDTLADELGTSINLTYDLTKALAETGDDDVIKAQLEALAGQLERQAVRVKDMSSDILFFQWESPSEE